MEVQIDNSDKTAKLLQKITGIFFGIFVTSIIIAISIQLLEVTGFYLGFIITAILIFLGFSYTKKSTTLRMITWGMTFTLILGIVLYFVGLNMISNLLEGF